MIKKTHQVKTAELKKVSKELRLMETTLQLSNSLKSNKVLINPPKGAFYLMPEFLNSKFSSSAEMCEDILNKTGVALLPGSDFGFKSNKMLTRLSFTDFDGTKFFRNVTNCKMIDDEMIKKYAPNVVEGVSKLSNWVKNL